MVDTIHNTVRYLRVAAGELESFFLGRVRWHVEKNRPAPVGSSEDDVEWWRRVAEDRGTHHPALPCLAMRNWRVSCHEHSYDDVVVDVDVDVDEPWIRSWHLEHDAWHHPRAP